MTPKVYARVTINGVESGSPPESTLCIVYVAINTVNSKFYIGATQRSLRVRKSKHLDNAKRGLKGRFYNAIRKYGAEHFTFISLIECKDFDDAIEKERRLISMLRPHYNMTDGGGGSKGYKHTNDAIEKMRNSHLGVKITNTARLEKMRANLAKQRSAFFRRVRCINDGIEFENVCSAARYYGISEATVRSHCSGKLKNNSNHFNSLGLSFEDIGESS